MLLDYDLSSIQEARNLAKRAKAAQEIFEDFSEEQIERIVKAMVDAAMLHAKNLAKIAVDETGYGIYEHKVIKNQFAAQDVYESIKNIKTVGWLKEDPINKVSEYAVPVGVILAITPTTNPTATVIHNAICAVKAGNAIVFAPHPKAVKCSSMAASILHDAAVKAGAPEGLITCITKTSMPATEEIMHHEDISVIIATGGSAMVKAAYSSGKPAFGVGPGNVPVFIERSADVKQAVKDIITSKTFDNGMICASEQAIIVDEPIKNEAVAELKAQGAYFLSDEEVKRVASIVMTPKGGMNAALVGQTAKTIAAKASVSVPENTKILIANLDSYGIEHPLAHEKLTTVLGFYTVKDWIEGCHLSIKLLKLGGVGHSMAIHSRDEKIIREFIQKPVFRILVNTPSALGGVGYSTGLMPSMTLGCGTWGGSSISENLGPHLLINIKRLTYGIKPVDFDAPATVKPQNNIAASTVTNIGNDELANIVKQVLAQLQAH